MMTSRKHFPDLSVPLLAYWACLLGALHLFVQLAGEVYEREGFFFDAPVLSWFANYQTSWLVGAAQTFSTIGSPLILGSLAAGVALWLGSRKPRAIIFLGLSLGGAMLLNVLFKLLFVRVRPALFEQLTPAPGYAFPSGHAMGAAPLSSWPFTCWHASSCPAGVGSSPSRARCLPCLSALLGWCCKFITRPMCSPVGRSQLLGSWG